MPFFERYIQGHFDSYEEFAEKLSIHVPENYNFAFDVVDVIAQEDPGRTAMLWCNDKGETKTFSFADMAEMSGRAANFFASLGIKKGDKVMLVLKRHYEFWFCILALHKLGAVAVPATHLLKAKDIVYRNNAADIRMIVCTTDNGLPDEVDEARKGSPHMRRRVIYRGQREGWESLETGLRESSAEFSRPVGEAAIHNEDPMLLYFTSGTTGMPKMVQHDFTYPLGHLVTAIHWQQVVQGGLHLTVSDTGWGKAVWGKLYGQWMAETAVFTYDFETFVPKDMLRMINEYQITSFCAPPTIYRFLIQEDLTQYDLSALRHCAIAGEALNPEIYQRFLEATGLGLTEGYGQTETTLTVGTFACVLPVPGSMGKPSPQYDVCIADESGKDVRLGEMGEIAIRLNGKKPIGMFMGYYKDEERTREALYSGLYRTGDMAWQDENGYYWFVGRSDDVIKSSGYRIGPFEVESALMEHPAVMETAITAVPDEVRGQLVKATVVLAKGYTASDTLVKELQDHVKHVTAPYKYPRIIEFVAELPKTISGKIRRGEIREKDSRKTE